ncbi:MAG: membrane dipeptidase [Ginsengibacter sp.]
MKKKPAFIFDGHLDLAMNAIEWNRDLMRPVCEIRERENGMTDKPDRGKGTVSLPELRNGNIGLVVATQIARFSKEFKGSLGSNWSSPEIAWSITQAQLAWYRTMEEYGEMTQICNLEQLENHLGLWFDNDIANNKKPVGYILSLEGADSLINISYLERAYKNGLRACGPAHYGPGVYASGTSSSGGLTHLGRELLQEMDNLDMILDVTHLTDEGFLEATRLFKGPIWASHSNCRSLVNHQRQLSDENIKILLERDSVIGGVLVSWMLDQNFVRGVDDPKKKGINMEKIIDHYDHICQLAGDSLHIAIGTDLDGGFGKEESPCDLETISDIQELQNLLAARGYSTVDIDNILFNNWLRFLRKAWG